MKPATNDLFHKAFARKGGLFEDAPDSPFSGLYAYTLNAALEALNYVNEVFGSSIDFVNLGFANKEGILAFANIESDSTFIGFGKETPLIIKFIFDLITSDRWFLTSLDNTKEVAPPKIKHVKFQTIAQIQKVYKLEDLPKPNGLHRQILSQVMLKNAIQYLTFHEVGHLLNGHIEYLKTNDISFEKLDKYDGQTTEIDADKFAARIYFKQALEYAKLASADEVDEEDRLQSEREVMTYAYGALYVLMRLFSKGEIDPDSIYAGHHPDPALRDLLFKDELDYCFKDREDQYLMAYEADQMKREIESFFLRLSTTDLGVGADLTAHLFYNEYEGLIRNLKNIRPMYSPFAKIKSDYDDFDFSVRTTKIISTDLHAKMVVRYDEDGKRITEIEHSPYMKRIFLVRDMVQGPEDLCSCGSGKMFKHCHGEGGEYLKGK
ncbi:MAG: SEC-C domain-containing protein [Mucilaginibacter sp.]|nr:SEC-C domain-containing protein [Mucilaginibacter sp.]